jgi:tetratricopeptide (TPR) repeat protein
MVIILAASGAKVNAVAELSVFERMLLPAYMFFFYLWRTAVPVSLSPVYPELDSLLFILSPIVAVIALVGSWMLLRRRRTAIPLALSSYVLFLMPVFFGLSSGVQPLADRYSYIAVISVFMLIAVAIEWLWRTSAASGAKKYRRRTLFAVLAIICAVSCYRTVRHVGVWNDSVSLWSQAERYIPLTRERYGERRPYMKPDHLDALTNLGTAYYATGNKDKALEQFHRILVLDERSADAHYNIGNLLYEQGNMDGAIHSFENAIKFDSLYVKAYFNMGIILANKGESQQGLAFVQKAAQLGYVDAQLLLRQQGAGW